MKINYTIKPFDIDGEMEKCDQKRKKKIESKINRKFSEQEWAQYKRLTRIKNKYEIHTKYNINNRYNCNCRIAYKYKKYNK